MDNEEIDNLNKAINHIRQTNSGFDYSIDLNDNKIKRYKGLASIVFDLEMVRDFISLLQNIKKESMNTGTQGEKVNQLLERSLFVSSIITYARCFAQTDGRGVKLESKDCFDQSHSEFKRLHEDLMETRNQYLAHAGVSNSEKIYASANFNVHDQDVSVVLSYEIIGQYGISSNDHHRFLDIVEHLLERTVKKRDEASKKYLDSLTLEEKQQLLKRAFEIKNARQ